MLKRHIIPLSLQPPFSPCFASLTLSDLRIWFVCNVFPNSQKSRVLKPWNWWYVGISCWKLNGIKWNVVRVSTGLLKIHKIHLQASCNYLYHWYTILLEDSLENGVIKAAWDTAGGGCLEKSREESMTVVVCCRNTGGIKKKCSCDKIMASDNHNARLRRQDWRGNKRQDLYNFLSFKPHNVTTEDCGKLLMLLEKKWKYSRLW